MLCDAPPLLPVTDAAILARGTSGAILVASAGRVTRHQLEGAVEALHTVGAKVAGFVMSMVPTRGPDSYYNGYGYGYGYGYTQEQPKAARGRKRKTPVAVVPDTASLIGDTGFDSRRDARSAGDVGTR